MSRYGHQNPCENELASMNLKRYNSWGKGYTVYL